MDYYYYNHQEQGNYLDADTSRYLKDKLFLALQVNIEIEKQNQKGAYQHRYIPLIITPILNHSGFPFRQFKCVYKQPVSSTLMI